MAIEKALLGSNASVDCLLCLDFYYSNAAGKAEEVVVPTLLISAAFDECLGV